MGTHILVIDAIATRRIALKVKLGVGRYNVGSASSATDALDALERASADLILIDAELPDALALCDTLQENPSTRDCPRVVLTDDVTPELLSSFFAAGAAEVIARPIDDVVFLTQLRALLRGHGDVVGPSALHGIPASPLAKDPPAQIAVVAPRIDDADRVARKLVGSFLTYDYAEIMPNARNREPLDAIVLLSRQGQQDAALTLLSDLKCHSATRRAGVVLVLDAPSPTDLARGFELGAENVMTNLEFEELQIRALRLAEKKRTKDSLRLRVRDGLRMAITDPLTGLHNRRYAKEKLSSIAEEGRDFALLMLDVDHFKRINDLHGHAIGDQVLCGVARALRANLRDSDLLARIGGEEFLVALPGASTAQAIGTAERLRSVAERMQFPLGKDRLPVRITLSVGLAHDTGSSPSVDEVMARADAALYVAKSQGRNMVSVGRAA